MPVTIRITQRGVYRGDGMVPVGTEITLDQEPTAWTNKYVVVNSAKPKTLEVSTPAPTPEPEQEERPKRRGRPRREEPED